MHWQDNLGSNNILRGIESHKRKSNEILHAMGKQRAYTSHVCM